MTITITITDGLPATETVITLKPFGSVVFLKFMRKTGYLKLSLLSNQKS